MCGASGKIRMLEAEISPTGTVVVEGHHVGELQGFRFTADQSAAGEDAKAIRAAAQKALAAEFETRADRFSASANGDIALGSDGVMRWIGAPIGTLTCGRGHAEAARHPPGRRTTYRPLARQGCGARRAFRQFPDRVAAEAAGRPQERRPDHRHRPRHRVQAGRGIRPDQPARHRRRREVARPGRTRSTSPPRRAFRRLPHLRPGARSSPRPPASSRCSGR